MANRKFEQFQYTLEQKIVTLLCKVAFGAAGAPTKDTGISKGVSTVARTAPGIFVFTFQDKYFELLMASGMHMSVASEDLLWQVSAYDLSAKTITLKSKAAAVDTDPSNGSFGFFEFKFRNTAVNRG